MLIKSLIISFVKDLVNDLISLISIPGLCSITHPNRSLFSMARPRLCRTDVPPLTSKRPIDNAMPPPITITKRLISSKRQCKFKFLNRNMNMNMNIDVFKIHFENDFEDDFANDFVNTKVNNLTY